MEVITLMAKAENGAYEDYLDKNVVIMIRNGRYIYGVLKSYDQYHSITLNFATERIFLNNKYSEKRHGLIILRGESILLVGMGGHFDTQKLVQVDFNMLLAEIEATKTDPHNSVY